MESILLQRNTYFDSPKQITIFRKMSIIINVVIITFHIYIILSIPIMNIDDLIVSIFDQNSGIRPENVDSLKASMLGKMNDLYETQQSNSKTRQINMLETYFKILQKISKEVREMKLKYENANQQDMKLDKLLLLATDIKFFRNECYDLRNQIKQKKQKVRDIKEENEFLRTQFSALDTAIRHRQSEVGKSLQITKTFIATDNQTPNLLKYRKNTRKSENYIKNSIRLTTMSQFDAYQFESQKKKSVLDSYHTIRREYKKGRTLKFFKDN